MVRILEFQRPDESDTAQGAAGKSEELPKGHSADIIIFPGVRIDRKPNDDGSDDHPENSAKRVKRPARRDR